jgi:hypothetical protein
MSDAQRVITLRQMKNLCAVRYNMGSWFTCSKFPYYNFPNQSDWSQSRNRPKILKFCILIPHWFLMTDMVSLKVIYVNPA